MRLPRRLSLKKRGSAAASSKRVVTRAAPRLVGLPRERLSLHVFVDERVEIVAVENVSVSGIAARHAMFSGARAGEKLRGRLLLDGLEIPLELDVVRVVGDLVGARFSGDTRTLRSALLATFAPELLAIEMHPVAKKRLQKPAKGEARWYTGGNGGELYFVVDTKKNGEILKLELAVFGIRFQLDSEERLLYAVDTAMDMIAGEEGSAAALRWSREVPAEATRFARRFVTAIPGIDREESDALIRVLGS